MNSFSGFVTKEFKQIYRDKRTLAVLFGMPIIMLVLFGFAIRNEVTNAQIGILDLSKDEVTRTLTQKLEASSSFQIQAYLESYEEVEGLFKQGNIKEIVVFEADFKEKLIGNNKADIQIITDATDPNLANLVQSYTSNIIRDYVQELNETSGVQQAGLNPKVRMMYNPELRSVNLLCPGLLL